MGSFGPMGVDMMLNSSLSSVFPDTVAVVSAVFMVFTWHLMYPFDLG